MTRDPMIPGAADRDKATFVGGLMAMTAVAALLVLAPVPAAAQASGKTSQNVTLESVPGSAVKRVVLTAKAAERLGIATGKVSEEAIVRQQTVGGLVVPPPPAPPPTAKAPTGFATVSAFSKPVAASAAPTLATGSPSGKPVHGEVWVRVPLSPDGSSKLILDRPVRVLPLASRNPTSAGIAALPSKMPPVADPRSAMQAFHYMVPGAGHGLEHWQRVRVKFEMSDNGPRGKVLPYAAVIYDAKGGTWVYTNPAPLTYVRQPIAVKEIVGDLAVLSDGPPVGTTVVTVGAALLRGAETLGK